MKRGTVDIGQLNLHLGRCHPIDVSLYDVLLATAGGLYHLVEGAVGRLKVVVGEMVGDVIDALGLLITD